jgi:hypothetical protein
METKTGKILVSGKEMAPQEVRSSSGPGPRRGIFMAIEKSSLPHARPSTDDHDDTIEAHYACLERPCACLDGWVFVGYIDEDGEEREASYACRRCNAGETR